uniref:Uncharacterized protein n=1 Tax=Parascaris equorum TaxID=6256 RepID=A0A914RF94_PAREQ
MISADKYAVGVINVGFSSGSRNRSMESLGRAKLVNVIELQLADTKEEMKQALEEQRCIHEAEMERLSRTHQIQIATLDSKLGEAEKQAVQLVRDKKALEA